MKTRLREARFEDLPKLVALGEQFREESEVWYPEIEPLAVYQRMHFFLKDPTAFAYVVEKGDKLLGFICGYSAQYTFSFEIGAHSDLLFVPKEYRHTKAPLLLVKKFVEWSDNIGALTVTMDLMTGIKPERVARFLSKFGFKESGSCMVRHGGNSGRRGQTGPSARYTASPTASGDSA